MLRGGASGARLDIFGSTLARSARGQLPSFRESIGAKLMLTFRWPGCELRADVLVCGPLSDPA